MLATSRKVWFGAALAVLLIAGAWSLSLRSPGRAEAHPLGNFTINRYTRIELTRQEVRLRYVLDMAEIPTFQEHDAIDRNGDGTISEGERVAYLDQKVESLRRGLRLKVDGTLIELRAVSRDLSFPPGQGGLDTERVVADFVASVSGAQHRVQFQDHNYDDRIGWREVVVRALGGARLESSNVPAQDVSDELRAYPSGGIANPLHVSSATFEFTPVTVAADGSSATTAVSQPTTARDRAGRGNPDSTLARFANLIAKDRLSTGVVILALIAAVGFGAIHALSPGHGKTIVAAYLVGNKGTWRHALLLALTVTATHTSSVYALGLVTLYLSQYVLPEDLYPWLGIASGGLIVAMGLGLLITRLRASGLIATAAGGVQRRLGRLSYTPHAFALATASPIVLPAIGVFGPAAPLATGSAVGDHDHSPHTHHDAIHAHDHEHGEISLRSLIGLGVFGGMLPCPSAIVVMVSAVALHRIAFGLVLIVAFSFGLAAVLSAIGFLLVYAGGLSRLPSVRYFASRSAATGRVLSLAVRAFPAGSAAAVLAAGSVVLLRALAQQGLL